MTTTISTITKKTAIWALIGFSILAMSFIFRKNWDCSKIKNGNFYYYLKESRDKVDIERSGNLQLETVKKTGQILKNRIIWKSDCAYTMYINALSDSKLEKIDSLISTIPISVDIVKIVDRYYICRSKFSIMNVDKEITDTIYIVQQP